jgi:hypothetical protein
MEDAATTCVGCLNLRGCPILSDTGGEVVLERIITPENPKYCRDWEAAGNEERLMRQTFIQSFGVGAVRAIHRMSKKTNMIDKEEGVNENIDLGSIIKPGITTRAEREEQLTYLTDEAGMVLVDEGGNKVPRRNLYLRKYAMDQLGMPPDQAAFWKVPELIRKILKEEGDKGFFGRPKKGAKEAAPSFFEAVKEPEASEDTPAEASNNVLPFPEKHQPVQPEVAQPQEQQMEQKAKVIVKRSAAPVAGQAPRALPSKVQQHSPAPTQAPAAQQPRMVTGPVTSKKMPAKIGVMAPGIAGQRPNTAPGVVQSQVAHAPAPAGNADVLNALQGMEARLMKAVDQRSRETSNEILASIDILRGELVHYLTNLHDAVIYRVQLNGSRIPICDENGNQLADENGEPAMTPYVCENPQEGLLAVNGVDITEYDNQQDETPQEGEQTAGEQ